MKFAQMAMAAALAAGLAVSAQAQTPPTSPTKPTPPMTTTGPKPMAPAATTSPPASSMTAPIDINSASAADLDGLPNIGKARAEAIIKGRPYKGKDDLLSRKILSPRVYNGIKDKIIAKQS